MIKGKRANGEEGGGQDVCVQSEAGIRTYQRQILRQRKSLFSGVLKIKWRDLKSAIVCLCSPIYFTIRAQEMIHLAEFIITLGFFFSPHCMSALCERSFRVCNLDDLQVCELSDGVVG